MLRCQHGGDGACLGRRAQAWGSRELGSRGRFPGRRGGFEMSPAPVPTLVPQQCCEVQPGLLSGPVPQVGAVLQGGHVGHCHGPGSLDGATAGSHSTVPMGKGGLVAWLPVAVSA